MNELASTTMSAWQSFYVIVGSSAAALIGIQFVVITLIANARRPVTADSISAFGTPTVVHLAGALFVSAVMSIPWPSLFPVSIVLAMGGFSGLAYIAIASRRAYRQTYYQTEWEDWLWYALVPCCVYAALMMAAFFLQTSPLFALFAIGTAAFGLLLTGIRNAWDTVTHIVVVRIHGDDMASLKSE